MTRPATRLRVVTGDAAVGRDLRDAGMEVVHVAGRLTPAQLAATAIQEDADCVLVPAADLTTLTELLAALDAADIAVLAATGAPDTAARIRATVAAVTG